VPIAHIWYFRSLPNKIGYILGLPSKKLDMIIYYERYVVIQAGIAKNGEGESVQRLDFLTEEEYLNILDTLPADNQYLMILIQINLLPKWEQNVLWIYWQELILMNCLIN
jgi:DNA-directed RNA polymerase subunit beta'